MEGGKGKGFAIGFFFKILVAAVDHLILNYAVLIHTLKSLLFPWLILVLVRLIGFCYDRFCDDCYDGDGYGRHCHW